MSGLESLTTVGSRMVISNNRELRNLEGLNGLSSVGGNFEIERNDKLISLEGLDNITSLGHLWVRSNDDLSFCGAIGVCNYLQNTNNTFSVYGNRLGCQTREEILNTCTNFGHLDFTIFYDQNQNGIKEIDEYILPNTPFLLEPINRQVISGSNTSSRYFLRYGDYTAKLLSKVGWEPSTSAIQNFSISQTNETANLEFGLFPKVINNELVATINAPPLRCNNEITFDISVRNLGTEFGTGTVWLDIDEQLTDFTHDADTISADWSNSIGWHFENLPPGHEFVKKVNIFIPGPPMISLGEIFEFKTFFRPIIVDGEPDFPDFVFPYSSEMRCSYDPNDKLVNPSRQVKLSEPFRLVNYTSFDEDLIYTVRFQNTGNDVAYDVVIRDTLDTNLDPSTIKIIGSSHYEVLNVSIEEERNVTFEFKDIFLPDSTTNFEASNGYVSYLIKTKDGLPEETPIQNTASIYFDFNPPIVTNTTENLMVTELPTISSVNENQQLDIHLFPNPTDGKIYLSGVDFKDAIVTIYDFTGRLVLIEKSGANEIVLPETASGMLFLKIETEEGTAVKRVFKK